MSDLTGKLARVICPCMDVPKKKENRAAGLALTFEFKLYIVIEDKQWFGFSAQRTEKPSDKPDKKVDVLSI